MNAQRVFSSLLGADTDKQSMDGGLQEPTSSQHGNQFRRKQDSFLSNIQKGISNPREP
ncbi:hypothetical protein CRENBAI_025130, partial [Crenichthys baileyi]